MSQPDDIQLTHKFRVNGTDVFVPIHPTAEEKKTNIVNFGKEYGVSQLMWATSQGNTNVITSDDIWAINMKTGETTFMPYEVRMI